VRCTRVRRIQLLVIRRKTDPFGLLMSSATRYSLPVPASQR
jgi:hypothetical protein